MNPDAENPELINRRRAARAQLVETGLVKDVENFVARMLRDKHHTALAAGNPDGARMVLEVAQWFADDLEETDPRFDRAAFVSKIMERPS
ncbi:MAG TPA: hypothetical protein VF066_18595 [Thermoleophilaceae bacterium]